MDEQRKGGISVMAALEPRIMQCILCRMRLRQGSAVLPMIVAPSHSLLMRFVVGSGCIDQDRVSFTVL